MFRNLSLFADTVIQRVESRLQENLKIKTEAIFPVLFSLYNVENLFSREKHAIGLYLAYKSNIMMNVAGNHNNVDLIQWKSNIICNYKITIKFKYF